MSAYRFSAVRIVGIVICFFSLSTILYAAASSAVSPKTLVSIDHWQPAVVGACEYLDSDSPGYDGTIELLNGHCHILDSTDHQPDFAEISLPGELFARQRFSLEFRCRMTQLGLTDQGTGHRSLFRILLGVSGDAGPFGFQMDFSHDRYNIGGNTKVYRIDSDWHTWRLEVNPANRQVAMFRDGEYVCLHEIVPVSVTGLRLQIQGCSGTPAEVELAELTILELPDEEPDPDDSQFTRRITASRTTIIDADWPMWRRDSRNSGMSPLAGSYTSAPHSAWTVSTGSVSPRPYWFDLDADGNTDALISHQGLLVAFRMDGTELWRQNLENVSIFGVHDLDVDGTRELTIAAGVPSQVHILDAATGRLRYLCPELPDSGVSAVRIARMNNDLKGLQAVVWSPMHEVGYCLSFHKGVEQTTVAWRFDWKHRFFHPTIATADMNMDGNSDLVVVTYSHAFVFDGRTGSPLMELEWNAGRNYGALVIRDINQDGYPDIVILAGQLREHIAVLQNEAGSSLRLLWDQFYEQNYPDDFVTLRVCTDAVADFDGDGDIEIAWSVVDERTDGIWRTVVADAVTGKVEQEIPAAWLAGTAQANEGKHRILLLSHPVSRSDLQEQQLEAWISRQSIWKPHSRLPKGRLLYADRPADIHPSVWAQDRHQRNGSSTLAERTPEPFAFSAGLSDPTSDVDRLNPAGLFLEDPDSGETFLVRSVPPSGSASQPPSENNDENGAAGEAVTTWKKETVWKPAVSITEPPAKENIVDLIQLKSGETPVIARFQADGRIEVSDSEGISKGGFFGSTGALTIPIVATLSPGQASSLLFMDSDGNLQCWRTTRQSDESPVLQWKRPASGMWSLYTPLSQPHGLPLAGDIMPQSGAEILVAEKPDRLIALDSDGQECGRWNFPALPQQWNIATLDDDEHPDLFVTFPTGAIIDVDTVAVSGVDGRILWKSHCGNGPYAIADVNSDGVDDIVMRDLYERRILDGRTGRDLQPIVMKAGYHTPMVRLRNDNGKYASTIWSGGNWSVGAEGADGSAAWWLWLAASSTGGVAYQRDGSSVAGFLTAGQIYQLPELTPLPSPDRSFQAYHADTGEYLWSHSVGATTSGIVSADLNGDGSGDFLMGTADGRLVALSAERHCVQRVLWEVSLPSALGVPVVCDMNHDGEPDIVVSCADGKIYCMNHSKNSISSNAGTLKQD